MKAHQATYTTATLCRVLGVSNSGYYLPARLPVRVRTQTGSVQAGAWRNRSLSERTRADLELTEQIQAIHKRSDSTYGAPRIHDELADMGIRVGQKRVARLMRQAGICGVSRRVRVRTTKRAKEAEKAPDLVRRDFSVSCPNQLWVADITYVPTWAGFLYLAGVLDAFSRRIACLPRRQRRRQVGWAMTSHLRTQLVLDALNMALFQRQPEGVIHHSDQGSQYTSIAFGDRCEKAGVRPSMGSVGDCYDNALCESFFATLECELIDRRRFHTHKEAKLEIFTYIEGWYNPHRRHSALGSLSPINYEMRALDSE